ncbi:MAG TPA: hypothetical protein DDW27_04750 [Bacteroidales bacterium]|nr:hypothetical protein [Bacteroidales bacterium]
MKPVFIIIITSLSISISTGQMSGFRGPERNGIYNEKGLMKTWPASGPQLLWEITGIGKGQSSATVTDDAIYITGRKGENDVLTCLNHSGRKIWEAPPINELTNYVNPLLIRNGSHKIIVTWTAHHLIAVNATNGKLLWKIHCEGLNTEQLERRNRVNTPVYRDGFILAANGYDQVAIKIKINPDGTDPVIIWKNTDLDPHVGGMVLLGNYIFSSNHITNSKGKWICVDWTTGKTMWITDWYNKGAIISADGMLYIIEEKSGHVGLLRTNGQKFDLVSSFQITKGDGPYFSHPTINKGRLFIRHGDYLAVYSIKAN